MPAPVHLPGISTIIVAILKGDVNKGDVTSFRLGRRDLQELCQRDILLVEA